MILGSVYYCYDIKEVYIIVMILILAANNNLDFYFEILDFISI